MRHRLANRLGLKGQMAISYVWVTVASILLAELLLLVAVTTFFVNEEQLQTRVMKTAQQYAQDAAAQIDDSPASPLPAVQLGDAQVELEPGQISFAGDLVAVPYIDTLYEDTAPTALALLIGPDNRILATSYPRRYPVGGRLPEILPGSLALVSQALNGEISNSIDNLETGEVVRTVAPVWKEGPSPVAALYIHVPKPEGGLALLLAVGLPIVLSGLVLVMLIAPIGAIFGVLTTRRLVRRLKRLEKATRAFAHGDFAQRLPVDSADEIGRLETQFNVMADQLVESIRRQKRLVKQNASLNERNRISRELHDSISQDLFSLTMLIGGLQSSVSSQPELQTHLETLEKIATGILREMRALLLEMRPTLLEEMSLQEAIHAFVSSYQMRLGITITPQIAIPNLDIVTENAILRIAQEAVSNAVRHANADAIHLNLKAENGHVILTVRDNGKGFTLNEEKEKHGLGLRLMRERVQELGGMMLIDAKPEKGTTLQIRLPRE